MTALTILFAIKMAITFWAVVVPILVAPKEMLDQLSGFGDPTKALYRLYALALTAQIIAYGEGLRQILDGDFPAVIVIMGLVSNGGAAWILYTSPGGTLKRIAVGLFGTIALLFTLSLLLKDLAMTPLL